MEKKEIKICDLYNVLYTDKGSCSDKNLTKKEVKKLIDSLGIENVNNMCNSLNLSDCILLNEFEMSFVFMQKYSKLYRGFGKLAKDDGKLNNVTFFSSYEIANGYTSFFRGKLNKYLTTKKLKLFEITFPNLKKLYTMIDDEHDRDLLSFYLSDRKYNGKKVLPGNYSLIMKIWDPKKSQELIEKKKDPSTYIHREIMKIICKATKKLDCDGIIQFSDTSYVMRGEENYLLFLRILSKLFLKKDVDWYFPSISELIICSPEDVMVKIGEGK